MGFDWVPITLGDVVWISLAFGLGFLARTVGLPPLVGFLATGFILNTQGIVNDALISKLADIGITMLLFTVGLKLNLRTLARPQVWAVTSIHMLVITSVFGITIYGLVLAGMPLISDLDIRSSFLIAFALSFSSTVFVVKVLEEKGEMTSIHGRIAIGILIMQDIAAVLFLSFSVGNLPSLWAFLLILLIPLKSVLHLLLQRVGHGELLVLYGFLLALGGAEIFELVGMKGDLGALVFGVLIANHAKADEMAKTMLSIKDLFLLGFFLSIGLSGELSLDTLIISAILTPVVLFKSALFFALLAYFKLRARSSLLTTFNLTNYSEFGLIVMAIGVSNGWVDNQWLVIISVALSLSFIIAAGLNTISSWLYVYYRPLWQRFQREERLDDDRLIDIQGAKIMIIGMGGIGSSAYDTLSNAHAHRFIGIDIDPVTVRNQQSIGRNVILGDPSDADFWDRIQASHTLELAMLSLPKIETNIAVLHRLREASYTGKIAVIAKFPDEVEALQEAGATTVFNVYTEAGAGFAAHVTSQTPLFETDVKIPENNQDQS